MNGHFSIYKFIADGSYGIFHNAPITLSFFFFNKAFPNHFAPSSGAPAHMLPVNTPRPLI